MPAIMTTLQAHEYAVKCHASTNHYYNGRPYEFHLKLAIEHAYQFMHLVDDADGITVLCAIWCHDVIEDCRQSYNDVKEQLGEQVADIVYACTTEKGKNRAERANDKYYEGIRKTQYATFVKLCDRMANVTYSKRHKGSMFDKYKKENEHFVAMLYDDKYKEMFVYLDWLFKEEA